MDNRLENRTQIQIGLEKRTRIPRRPGNVSVGPLVSTGHKMPRQSPTWQQIGLTCSNFSCLPSTPARQVRPSRLKAHGTANHASSTCQRVSKVLLVHYQVSRCFQRVSCPWAPADANRSRIESKLISRRARFKLPNLVTVEEGKGEYFLSTHWI